MKVLKNLFGKGDKIHVDEIAVAPGLLLGGAVIVESGNNTNGYYVKFGDGTMICWGTVPGVTPTYEPHSTGVWRSPVLYYDYPQPFYGINPSVSVSVGSPGNYGIWHESASSSLNQWSYRMFAMGDQSGYGVGIARFLAIGRWK